MPLDIVVFDSDPAGLFSRRRLPHTYRATQAGLVASWIGGVARLLVRRRTTVSIGATSWETALPRIVEASKKHSSSIHSIQFWGHAAPGRALLGKDSELTLASLREGHKHHDALVAVRERLHDEAYWWFRGCSTIAGRRGQRFATVFADAMQMTVVAHTYTIGPFQSGGHAVQPGQRAQDLYDPMEGVAAGSAERPTAFKMSGPDEPNTVLATAVTPPAGWWIKRRS